MSSSSCQNCSPASCAGGVRGARRFLPPRTIPGWYSGWPMKYHKRPPAMTPSTTRNETATTMTLVILFMVGIPFHALCSPPLSGLSRSTPREASGFPTGEGPRVGSRLLHRELNLRYRVRVGLAAALSGRLQVHFAVRADHAVAAGLDPLRERVVSLGEGRERPMMDH